MKQIGHELTILNLGEGVASTLIYDCKFTS